LQFVHACAMHLLLPDCKSYVVLALSVACEEVLLSAHFANCAAQNVAWTQQTQKGIQSVKLVISNQHGVIFHITWNCTNSSVRTSFATPNTSSCTEAILTKIFGPKQRKAVYLQRGHDRMLSYVSKCVFAVWYHPTTCLWNAHISNPWIWFSEVEKRGEIGLRVDIASVLNSKFDFVCIPLSFVFVEPLPY
jgi:hypothetical protein